MKLLSLTVKRGSLTKGYFMKILQLALDVIDAVLSLRFARIRLYIQNRHIYLAYRDFTEPIFIPDPGKEMSEFETDCYAKITAAVVRMRACGVKKWYLTERLKRISNETNNLQNQVRLVIEMSKHL